MSGQMREAWREELSRVLLARVARVAMETSPAREATFGEMADAIIDEYDLAEDRHLVRFTESGWTIQHPVAERLIGSLLDCDVHELRADLLERMPDGGPGDYWIERAGLVKCETSV